MQAAADPTREFERHRARLHALAQRVLSSEAEAEDVVQEGWVRFSQTQPEEIANAGAWLTTVVTRLCLDRLRARRRQSMGTSRLQNDASALGLSGLAQPSPETQVLLADRVGLAMLVVLERLKPAERAAFILHDVFELPFDEIAPLMSQSVQAARQLASRARRRVYCSDEPVQVDLPQQRMLAESFLRAARTHDVTQLMAMLAPNVVLKSDLEAARLGPGADLQGASAVAAFFAQRGASAAEPIMIDGMLGVLVAPEGRLLLVLRLRFSHGKIARVEAVASTSTLASIDLRLPLILG